MSNAATSTNGYMYVCSLHATWTFTIQFEHNRATMNGMLSHMLLFRRWSLNSLIDIFSKSCYHACCFRLFSPLRSPTLPPVAANHDLKVILVMVSGQVSKSHISCQRYIRLHSRSRAKCTICCVRGGLLTKLLETKYCIVMNSIRSETTLEPSCTRALKSSSLKTVAIVDSPTCLGQLTIPTSAPISLLKPSKQILGQTE